MCTVAGTTPLSVSVTWLPTCKQLWSGFYLFFKFDRQSGSRQCEEMFGFAFVNVGDFSQLELRGLHLQRICGLISVNVSLHSPIMQYILDLEDIQEEPTS